MPKAGYYAFAETAKPVIVSVKHENGRYGIYVCNDGRKNAEGTLTITAENFNDKSHTWTCDFMSVANTFCVAMEISEAEMDGYTDKTSLLLCSLKSDMCNHHTRYYLSKPANVVYPEADIMVLEEDERRLRCWLPIMRR
jgi:hypothetical protein